MNRAFHAAISAILFCLLAWPQFAAAGRIVLANDEWPLSNTGFSNSPSVENYIQNIANLFADGGSGTFHAYSTNFGLTESSLAAAFSSAGHTLTTGTGITFNVPTLLTYDGVFFAGEPGNISVLTDYVNAGGNVYLAGGTTSNAPVVANFWNPFLNSFGLGFESVINVDIGGAVEPIESTHPIFANVTDIYQAGGQGVLDIDPNNLQNQVLEFNEAGTGLYALYDSSLAIPIPAVAWLFPVGLLAGLAWMRKRVA